MPNQSRWMSDDVIAADRQAAVPPTLKVSLGMELAHPSTGTIGEVVAFTEGERIILKDRAGKRHEFAPIDGFFEHNRTRVALRAAEAPSGTGVDYTRSGSRVPEPSPAKVARASRIWVEGIHDAELLEKIWGDDLRAEAIVVEPLHGADELASAVAAFGPGPGRRLGVLLDHLVEGSKEARIADSISHPDLLIAGHPYVDIWEAIQPSVIGLDQWPKVPRDLPWKEGVVAALDFNDHPSRFWREVLSSVDAYTDLETPLVNAVERLVDFVTGD